MTGMERKGDSDPNSKAGTSGAQRVELLIRAPASSARLQSLVAKPGQLASEAKQATERGKERNKVLCQHGQEIAGQKGERSKLFGEKEGAKGKVKKTQETRPALQKGRTALGPGCPYMKEDQSGPPASGVTATLAVESALPP